MNSMVEFELPLECPSINDLWIGALESRVNIESYGTWSVDRRFMRVSR